MVGRPASCPGDSSHVDTLNHRHCHCVGLVGDVVNLVTRAPGATQLLTHVPVSDTNKFIPSASHIGLESFTLVCHCLVYLAYAEIVSTQEQPDSIPLQTRSRVELTNSEGPVWKNVTFPSGTVMNCSLKSPTSHHMTPLRGPLRPNPQVIFSQS